MRRGWSPSPRGAAVCTVGTILESPEAVDVAISPDTTETNDALVLVEIDLERPLGERRLSVNGDEVRAVG